MDALIGIAGLLTVSALTPGPNNLLVMQAGAHGGLARATPVIVGVVLGSLALLLVIAAGLGAVFVAEPWLRMVVTASGCVYLAWIGARLLVASFGRVSTAAMPAPWLPTSLAGVVAFQFLNPKAWIMVLTASSAASAGVDALAAFAQLAVLFALIPGACLALWGALGALMTERLRRRAVRRWFDRAMGALLIASAAVLPATT